MFLQMLTVLILLAASYPSYSCAGIQYNHTVPPEITLFGSADINGGGTRIRGMRETRDADFILAGLFPVHSRGYCEVLNRVNIIEAMLFALDNINSDSSLLPNVTLGYDIRDTCFIEQIGLDEAAELIITSTQSVCTTTDSQSTNETTTNSSLITIGLVGAASSSVSIPIAGLTRLFTVPQVSYASTSDILGDRDRYSYFYRTVSSDSLEVQALIDVIEHFGWTYISTIFSRNSYGRFGIDELLRIAGEKGICIDLNEGIDETASEDDYRNLAEKLSESQANVVVFYATRGSVQELFKQLENVTTRHFTWIASSGWTQLADEFPPSIVSGFFGVLPISSHANTFDNYYSNLTLSNNLRDPWFPEFVYDMFNCSSAADCPQEGVATGSDDFFVPLIIDAVYTHAHALENYLNDLCESPVVWNRETNTCNGQNGTFDRANLLQYIASANFTSLSGNHVFFNDEGSVQSFRYRVTNYQARAEPNGDSYSLETIGVWNSEFQQLELNQDMQVQFFNSSGAMVTDPVRSDCGTCAPGQYVRRISGACCGLCDSCLGMLFSNVSQASACSNCSVNGDEMWGNNPTFGSTGCVEIPKVFLDFSHPFSIVVSIGSGLGLILLIVAVVMLAVFWTSPVIKASSRESVILILIGAACSFAASFIYLSPPSLTICILQRILLWFCFSLMSGSLLVKVVRIARIFVFERSVPKQLKCVQWYHQILLSLLIVCGQMIIVLLSVAIVHPQVLRDLQLNSMNLNSLPEIAVTCQPEPILGLIVSVLYEAGLILITVVLGTMTFKSPANFNESKTICVSAYILLTIWTMFFISYFFTDTTQGLQNAFIALTTTLGAYTILVSVIGPRLFTVIFRKNEGTKNRSRNTNSYDVSPTMTMNTTATTDNNVTTESKI